MGLMRKYILILVISFAMSLTNKVFADLQNIQIESNTVIGLSDCIKIALNNSPVVKRTIFNLDIAKSSIGVAKSAYFPSLKIGGSYSQSFGERNHNLGSYQNRILPGFDTSLSQLLWNFGRADANIKMQKKVWHV